MRICSFMPLQKDMKSKNAAIIEMKNYLNSIYSLTDEYGNILSDVFLQFPSSTSYPLYVQAVKKPMSLKIIEKKLENGKYRTLKKFVRDLRSLVKNIKDHFRDNSKIYKQAALLEVQMSLI